MEANDGAGGASSGSTAADAGAERPLWQNAAWITAVAAVLAALVPFVIFLLSRDADDGSRGGGASEPEPGSTTTVDEHVGISISSVARQGGIARVVGIYEGELGNKQVIVVIWRPASEELWQIESPPADADPDGTWQARVNTGSSDGEVSAAVVGSDIFDPDPCDVCDELVPSLRRLDLQLDGPEAETARATAEPVSLED